MPPSENHKKPPPIYDDDEESDPGYNSGGMSDAPSNSQADDEAHFTRSETKLVNRSKLLVYLALLCAAAAVCAATYIFLSNDEENTMAAEVSLLIRDIVVIVSAVVVNLFIAKHRFLGTHSDILFNRCLVISSMLIPERFSSQHRSIRKICSKNFGTWAR
jgi:hypothetical protein